METTMVRYALALATIIALTVNAFSEPEAPMKPYPNAGRTNKAPCVVKTNPERETTGWVTPYPNAGRTNKARCVVKTNAERETTGSGSPGHP